MGNWYKVQKQKESCVYCGSSPENLTVDHIPPKCLFPKGTEDLITVPACSQCNNGASKDDEYFRQMIVFSIQSSDHPEAKEIIDRALRNLSREEAKDFTATYFDTLARCYVVNKQRWIEPSMKYPVELQRIGNVVFRIVKGLFWKETQMRLPQDFEVVVVPSYNIEFTGRPLSRIVHEVLSAEHKSAGNRKSIGNGVFQYWWKRRFSEKVPASVWVLRFYGGTFFICFVAPKEKEWQNLFRNYWQAGLVAVSDKVVL